MAAFLRNDWVLLVVVLVSAAGSVAAQDGVTSELGGSTLQHGLRAAGAATLARVARAEGDAVRGAILFHQPHVGCATCHAVDGTRPLVGPNLTDPAPAVTDDYLVEAILEPSKTIRQGFEAVTVATVDGRTLTGLVVEDVPDRLVLRDPTRADPVTLAPAEVESRMANVNSLMPNNVVDQLTSRQQFLDLVRYVMEIRAGGPDRARELQPAPALIALQLPEYEARVDHSGLLRDLDGEAFERGRAIYQRLCINCHGTPEALGSLPTSLRFASGKFKNGSDPYSMYQTLTRGFGLMVPQTWMVPQQKYDVIHFIREAYVRPLNPTQYVAATDEYLARLPVGDTRGPAPLTIEPWVTMDYGPSLIGTYEAGNEGRNIAQKGIAVRLDAGPGGISRGRAWSIFDHDTLRMAAAWTGNGFIDWHGIHFDGMHQTHPRLVGDIEVQNPAGPGWADPATGSFVDDQRVVGRDGRRYGPLPRRWARYRGLYQHGDRVVIAYTVGETSVLEQPGLIAPEEKIRIGDAAGTPTAPAGPTVFARSFQIGPRTRELVMLVATLDQPSPTVTPRDARALNAVFFGDGSGASVWAGIIGDPGGGSWTVNGSRLCLRLPAGAATLRFTVWTANGGETPSFEQIQETLASARTAPDLTPLTQGGPPRWPEKIVTTAVRGAADGAFAVDVLTRPENNPWLAQVRCTGLDFYPDGDRALVCAWDGDVWCVSGLRQLDGADENSTPQTVPLTWQRIACGMFQPLGIKLVNDAIYVTCRDQLVVLRDLNGDGESDLYECFNNDHQVTEHFHEFAMGLQVDEAGNFYYAKSARHALPAIVPHHGTLLRISRDGATTEILARGFRAANGVCLNPDGSYIVTDQEGHWNPKNRINWVTSGGFYGNMFGYHDVTDESDAAMEQPVCWITNAFDRSPAELLWVPQDTWGPLAGSLLNLSYGYGKLYVVPFEMVEGKRQGGMCALPIAPLPTGIMRGRFHPHDRQLYVCGMFAWAGSATEPGGFFRIRVTGQPMFLPLQLQARPQELSITFTDPLDRETMSSTARFALKTWSLKRTANYGSDHYDERPLAVTAVSVSPDGRTVKLTIPNLQPSWCMEIVCRLTGADGQRCERVIHNSIFRVGE